MTEPKDMAEAQEQAEETGETAAEAPPGIAERVRFWEEQERINQVLIPKVLRQHELLVEHVKEHENLHELFQSELSPALEKQSRYLRTSRWLMIATLVCALISVSSLIAVATSSASL